MYRLKKLTALFLIMFLVFSFYPVSASAAAKNVESKVEEEAAYGFMPSPHIGSRALTDAYLRGEGESTDESDPAGAAEQLPARYDSRDYGYVTPVKNQNPYGTCWAFATTAPIESYMIKHGIINPDTGAAATTGLNLSEYHLAWFSYTSAYDQAGMLAGDATSPVGGKNFLNSGGNGAMASYTLMTWEGPASEAVSALSYSRASTSGLSSSYAYSYDNVHVEDTLWIPGGNVDAIKRAILEYGACTINYYHNSAYMNPRTYAMCFKQTAEPFSDDYMEPNHAVTVVGWDDNYSKSNFLSEYGPSNDGAWIVKNSWGFSVFDQGYFYLSYEDSSAVNDYCYFFKVADKDKYQHNYQYDGTSNFVSNLYTENNTQIANVFTAQGSELLKAVAVSVWDEGISYTLDIYKNPTDARNPSSGTKVATQTGSFSYFGYFTVPLNTPVPLNAGDSFAVVFTLSAPGAAISIPYDASYEIGWIKWTHANRGDTSFYRTADGAWKDCPNNGDFRIKAYTDDYVNTVTYTVSAESNNTAYGTVSVVDNSVFASPAAGYYVSDCEVLSGSATCTIEGNTILVSPESDCVIRVIFAPLPTFTVRLMACGVEVDSRNVLLNGTTVLPSAVPQTPEGWTFCGWTSQPVAETSGEPTYYNPGATCTVTGNATFYALYCRTEGNSELGFQKLTSVPEVVEGTYVITNADATNILMGVSTADTYMSNPTRAPSLFSTGAQLNGDLLTNVASVYQFSFTAHGSAYWMQNVSLGSYVGSTSAALYALTERSTGILDWSLSFQNDAPQLCNRSKNYAITFNGSFFQMASGASTSIALWKEAPVGTTYYSTDFHVHTVQFVPEVAPTCTEAGQNAYYFCDSDSCPLLGRMFADEALTDELTELSVPALGHEYQDSVTIPTCVDQGYTTYTCSRCGDSYVDSYTDALGHNIVNGVCTVCGLVVVSEPVITSHPEAQTVGLGKYATFTVVATGEYLCYQWQYQRSGQETWNDWAGKTSATLKFKATSTNNAYRYRCVVSNAAGSETSEAATLTVIAKPVISTNPGDATVVLGKNATFTVEATGENLRYQWQYQRAGQTTWHNWSGKTSATLTFRGTETNNAYRYRCVVTNEGGSTTSEAATLTVIAKPVITTQPQDTTVVLGEFATFTVEASGENLRYQWQYKRSGQNTWYNWSGKTSATLTFRGTASNNAYQYRCIVTNAAGSVTSNAATLTVVASSNSVYPELA